MTLRNELVVAGRRPERGDYIVDDEHEVIYGPIVTISDKTGSVVLNGSCHSKLRLTGVQLHERGLRYARLDELPPSYTLRRQLEPGPDRTVAELRRDAATGRTR